MGRSLIRTSSAREERFVADGHDVGDQLLSALGKRLISCTRAGAFADPFTIDRHQLRLTASIGRAVFPIDADSADGLLRRADASMFANKRGAVGRASRLPAARRTSRIG